jgi:hypothetical protein
MPSFLLSMATATPQFIMRLPSAGAAGAGALDSLKTSQQYICIFESFDPWGCQSVDSCCC